MQNHEVWADCPVCGNEYDLRNGEVCPECGGELISELVMGGAFHPTNKDND